MPILKKSLCGAQRVWEDQQLKSKSLFFCRCVWLSTGTMLSIIILFLWISCIILLLSHRLIDRYGYIVNRTADNVCQQSVWLCFVWWEKRSAFFIISFFVYKVFVRPKSHLYKELCVKSTCQLPAAGHSATTMSSAAIIILSMQKPWNFWSHKPLLWFSFFLILFFEGTYELAPHFQLKIKLTLFSRRIYFFPWLYFHYHCFPTDEDSI